MWLNVFECVAILAAALLASLLASPKALRGLSCWLLALACMVEYLYEEIAALARRAVYLRQGELQFYREKLELESKPKQDYA